MHGMARSRNIPGGLGDSVPQVNKALLPNGLVRACRDRASVGDGGGGLSSPTARTTLQHMPVVEQTIEHGGDGSHIAQQFAPVLDGAVGSEQRAGALVAP